MDPNSWGPYFWKTIHAAAIEADRQYTQDPLQAKEHFSKFLHELSYILPCETCRGHMQAYLKTNPITESDFFLWSFQFHNAVNYRLGKIQLNYEDALHQWSTESCGKCSSEKSTNYNYLIFCSILFILFFVWISWKHLLSIKQPQ